jgi:Tfp pilus assembly protein PilZ
MAKEDRAGGQGGTAPSVGAGVARAESPRAFRRQLPFGRGAVLMVGTRAHIVGVADVSVSGAYLTTRAPVSVGEQYTLKMFLLPQSMEVSLKVEIVRVAGSVNESAGKTRGVGVRFLDMDERTAETLRSFVARAQASARP